MTLASVIRRPKENVIFGHSDPNLKKAENYKTEMLKDY